MMAFLIKHELINPSQHGFLKARSCLTNLLCFFEEITKWVDEGSPVDVIYLDFQKAFDKVPHQRLILKLKSHGMGKSIINWIEQWLKDRIHDMAKHALPAMPHAKLQLMSLTTVVITDINYGRTETLGGSSFVKMATIAPYTISYIFQDLHSCLQNRLQSSTQESYCRCHSCKKSSESSFIQF